MRLKEIALELLDNYHVTLRYKDKLSVIVAYKSEIDYIAEKYNLKVEDTLHSLSGNTIQGVFTLKNN